ncbi:hypothetical protein GCM10009677_27080 [Sphaerisporangium rubeum]|uniref:DUF4240 domain-containing protein n=1 Tax=Sphaerisporangium rubeum TaxID=321317 RepID=A0A7X0ICU6_9ACTN|nr:DUF4240 domain-containing protein [Sphaerisporangium rubeum]MBB6472645.1 hypothetical protein [Sphaerisporangium rubeum]
MTDDAFWELVDVLGGVVDEESADDLRERFSSLTGEQIEGFAAQLSGKVRVLAALPLEGAPVPDGTAPGGALPLLGDALENLLYAVVAAGRDAYSAVVADPASAEDDEWDAGEAELLPDVVAEALWNQAGLDWYDDFDPFLAGLPADTRWYATSRGSAWKGVPRHYEKAAHALDLALNDSEAWRAWWRQTSLDRVKAAIVVNTTANRVQIERGRKIVRAEFQMDRDYFGGRDATAMESLVAEEAQMITKTLAEQLHMSPPPPLPPVLR